VDVTITQQMRAERITLRRRAIVPVEHRKHARAEAFEIRQRFIEPVRADERRIADVALPAQVPFAEMPGGIAGMFENSREHRRFRI
jgi:hypothetical protein